ncbi:hypothetical protein AFCDBAGC_4935 [Methylobacterium cerastii]|uniref:Cell division protein DivIVA n=1 Tax=Methylobacterium cerastii TaxID=932741 RepID=A0ABQ4QQF9_9HYPH|nr:cell division protein DivIVA [Methylobacterium cerastii]GJD47050.1 hypothetical protein AFCDBAGC_4935 [Methylobacterium cerastii]
MAAAPLVSWAQILTQVAASFDSIADKPSAEILLLKPSFSTIEPLTSEAAFSPQPTLHPSPLIPEAAVNDVGASPSGVDTEAVEVGDWMSTLDIINGMAGLAGDQKKRLREQSVSHQAALEGLERALKQTQQLLQLSEMRVQEIQTVADVRLQKVQADADAQVQEIRAEAEARVSVIRAETDAWVRTAEEQVRVADLRASTAEKWLQRIDAAAKNLLLGGHMSLDQAQV